jgi:hypothetical protein
LENAASLDPAALSVAVCQSGWGEQGEFASPDTGSGQGAAAKGYAAKQGGGEMRIHGRDGAICDSDTVARARDPNPPRDKRH